MDFLRAQLTNSPAAASWEIAIRLLLALALGGAVAWIHRRARGRSGSPSFAGTLVLLSVLIAMVTQVIGDNVARAFSLVGALSIVRFRTVVRDTQDTAYVIFAVVVGMAVGAHDLWVALLGIMVVGLAAWLLRTVWHAGETAQSGFLLILRVGSGVEPESLLVGALEGFVVDSELVSVETAKQGFSVEVTYLVRLRPDKKPDALLKALNGVEGVQRVEMRRRGFVEE